ncbi:putative beta-lysine N-acetyltransferase [Anaerobacillus alkaliphilus]|uniref:Putative beta-lysine N-acetyltransferase n=1 Tax=Anaerobacillus alkaliphilus TaxID=1548597 RepID=A0A4Q0VMQ8_9BACI|nr:putative beta-lysine N-acetyltransferase [Anaerobacillus alkaliphilus]RXI96687.1 putative beta-lysine N-acetyltransferase [Anaerobacillus alkaliphilus]
MGVPYISNTETGPDFFIDVTIDFINERIRVDDYRGNINSIMARMKALAEQYSFTKVIIKARGEDWRELLARGYTLEGMIDRYFNGSDAYFMVYYLNDNRRTSLTLEKEDEMCEKIFLLPTAQSSQLPDGYLMRLAGSNDCQALAELYGRVFQTYPTPMNEPEYIRKVMDDGTIFFVVEWKGEIVSAASAEVNEAYHNAEMTDCATLPEHRKYGFMQLLLSGLEQELTKKQIYCAYSLARAQSYGMNACLKKLDYQYRGRLMNNCIMNGAYENMNVWVKRLV